MPKQDLVFLTKKLTIRFSSDKNDVLKGFSVMYRVNFSLVLLAVLLNLNPAHSMFGQSDVPLIEYYEFGKRQTGVAIVSSKSSSGTANLIDVADDTLKGRLLITCAHVLKTKKPKKFMVEFMDENNARQSFDVHKTFIHPDYDQNPNMDIAFILLEKPVDILKFNPLKLNLTRNNDSLKGQPIDVFGCSPIFGKADCHMVFCDDTDRAFRLGMTTIIHETSDASVRLVSHFYKHEGMLKVLKKPILENDPRHIKIRHELARLEEKIKTPGVRSNERLDLLSKKIALQSKSIQMSVYTPLGPIYSTDHFENDLMQLKDTETLDKTVIIERWKRLMKDEKYESSEFELGDYHIFMHRPLPRLSAQVYHGDSGGAWVQGDEIVALTSSISDVKRKDELFIMDRKLPTTISSEDYFAQCEKELEDIKSLKMADPLIDDKIGVSYAISIWSHKEWIEKTLKEIVDQKL